MGNILRIAYRHLEAIKTQVRCGLANAMESRPFFSLKEWIAEREPEFAEFFPKDGFGTDYSTSHTGRHSAYGSCLYSLILDFEDAQKSDAKMKCYTEERDKRTSGSVHVNEDMHDSAKGGGWDVESFILRSALVLTLGVRDGYERDVIWISDKFSRSDRNSSSPVIHPTLDDLETKATKRSKKNDSREIGTCASRRKIFRDEYRLAPLPKTEENAFNAAWDNRNHLAHGYRFSDIEVSLTKFLKMHYNVFSVMNHLAEQCLSVHRIEI